MPVPIDITAVLGSVTPPGRLRRAVDEALQRAAARDDVRPVVAMGGSDHHYLGVERHLRDVLSFFGAHPLPTAVYLASRDFHDGVPGDRAAGELDELLDALMALTRAYRELGLEAFILSGYPHVAEGDLFARHVLPRLAHGPLPRRGATGPQEEMNGPVAPGGDDAPAESRASTPARAAER